jgi:hypothetical protein
MTEAESALLDMVRARLDQARSAWLDNTGSYAAFQASRDVYDQIARSLLIENHWCMAYGSPGAAWDRPNPYNRMMDASLCPDCIRNRHGDIR